MWESRSCVCVHILYVTCVYLTVSIHCRFFLHLHLCACALNEIHLDIYSFIIPCNNISPCDGKQAERGHRGGGLLCEPYLTLCLSERGLCCIVLEQTMVFPVHHRWVVMDTRPPLVKPRCPCFIRHPTGSPALLISGFRQLAPRPSSTSHWPLLLKESSSLQIFCFPYRWIHGRAENEASRFLQTCKSSVNVLVSRSDACWKKIKILLNAFVSMFLGFNKDGQLQRIGRESQTESLSCRYAVTRHRWFLYDEVKYR